MKEIIILSAKHGKCTILVDDQDYESISKHKWHIKKWKGRYYANCKGSKGENWKNRLMHRMLLGFPSFSIDHIDGDGLNNQRNNLRPATQQQNIRNRDVKNKTGYKGVWETPRGKFSAVITIDSKRLF